MKILVTGASGQLGLSIRDAAQCSVHEFIYSDINASGDILALDVTNLDAVRKVVQDNGISAIINCAAYTDVNAAESDLEAVELVNVTAPGILARVMNEVDGLLVHISTDYVFDGTLARPYSETDQANPVNAYGRSKLMGEKAVEASGCRHMILRTSWLYSNYGRNFYRNMIELTAENPVVKVVSDQIGTPTWASDLADAIVAVLDENMPFDNGVYHYSNEGVCSWYDFAKEICVEAGHLCDVLPCRTDEYPTAAVRPQVSVLDKTRFKETFGIEIPHWRESLLSCMSFREE